MIRTMDPHISTLLVNVESWLLLWLLLLCLPFVADGVDAVAEVADVVLDCWLCVGWDILLSSISIFVLLICTIYVGFK